MASTEFERARAAWNAGEHQRALALLDELLTTTEGEVEHWSTRGLWLEALGRIEDALSSFRRSTAITPSYPDHYNAGNMLLQLGRLDQAIAEFDASIACNDRYPEAWVNRGIAHYQAGRAEPARESFERALAIDAEFLPALRCMLILERNLGRRAELEPLLARLARAQPEDPAAAYELARALAQLPEDRHLDLEPHGRSWRALEAIRRAIELAPDDPRCWALEANLLGMLMHANTCFRRLRRTDDGVEQELVPGPLRTGSFFAEQQACCEAAMARFVDDPWFPNRLADAHEFVGDWPRVVELRRRACALAPKVADYQLGLALALAELGELEDGAIAARRAIELDPSLAAELPADYAKLRGEAPT